MLIVFDGTGHISRTGSKRGEEFYRSVRSCREKDTVTRLRRVFKSRLKGSLECLKLIQYTGGNLISVILLTLMVIISERELDPFPTE